VLLQFSSSRRRRGWIGPAVVILAGLALPGMAEAESLTDMLGFGQPADASPGSTRVAQSQQQMAQLLLQLQQLQEQVRTLTGQVDGLQFQVTQLQTAMQKQQADNEYRFQQLEGGKGGAPAPSGPVSPRSDAAPAGQGAAGPAAGQASTDTSGQTDWSATDNDTVPADRLGPSHDPLVGSNAQPGQTAPLTPGAAAPAQPPDANPRGVAARGNPAADAQYNAGYAAVTHGDYKAGAEQLGQFLKLYPDDPHAADATSWLGEALLQQGRYDDAAQVLVNGFKKYRDSSAGADILLNLGVALSGAQEGPAACKTFAEAKRRYPDAPAAFKRRLATEASKAKCSG
jgi:tol-pal system protein YbgF